MSVISIRTNLLAKLNAMQTLKQAYDYEASNEDAKHPLATITFRDGDAEFASTAHNRRMHGFVVHIYQEQTKVGQGSENAERITAEVLDELYTAFDMDTTLSGTCKFAYPVSWNAGYVDREFDSRFLEININAVDIVSAS